MFRSRESSVLSLFVAVMLLVFLLLVASVADAARKGIANAKAGRLILKGGTYEIEGTQFKTDFGTFAVPENRNKPDSRLIHLPAVRIHATGENPVEPVFLLADGPGNSNIWDCPPEYLLKHHDIVMVGYRGVDGSVSLDCPEIEGALKLGKSPLSSKTLDKLGKAWYAAFQRLKKEGVDIDGYNMVEVIDDMEDARKALGYEKVNLYGRGYGSRIAYFYGLRYSQSIHRILMCGVNPPGRQVWEPEMVDAQLRYYADLWKRDPECASKSPDIIKTMQNVLNSLPRNWYNFMMDPEKVKITTFIYLFHRNSATSVFDAYVAAEKGDYSGLAYLSIAYDKMIPNFMNWGDAASKAFSADYDHNRNYEAEMDPPGSIIGSPMAKLLWGHAKYGGWPIKPIPQEYRELHYSDPETLIVSGSIDFSSPVEYAKELLPYLRNGKHVILAEMGHCLDLETIQPDAYQYLVETFYLEGIVDDSKFRYEVMDFTPSQTFQNMAKQFAKRLENKIHIYPYLSPE